jgi:hypothetical protein
MVFWRFTEWTHPLLSSPRQRISRTSCLRAPLFIVVLQIFLSLFHNDTDSPFVAHSDPVRVTTLKIGGNFKRMVRDIKALQSLPHDSLRFPTPFILPTNSTLIDFSDRRLRHRFYRSGPQFLRYYANLSFTWQRFFNVIAVQFGGIYVRRRIYYYSFTEQHCQPVYRNLLHHYDIVFNYLHRWRYYGHYLIDYIPVLTALSDHYLKKAIFIVRQRTTFSVQAIQLFGVPNEHIVELRYGELAFARELFMINPLQVHAMNALLLTKMRAVFVKKLALDVERPFRYVLYNRPGKRWVTNFQDIFAHCEPKWPTVSFELYQDEKQKDFRSNIAYYNEMIFAMSCHSSGFLNVIFQQSNTVAAVVESRQSDGNLFVAMSKIFNRHLIVYRWAGFEHCTRAVKLPMYRVIPAVVKGIELARAIEAKYVRVDCPVPRATLVLGAGFSLEESGEAHPMRL